ncbi:NAD(P)H-dependent glycerol-3-phosphate dehydrogenase [Naumannella halotolerans]|uniref:Glycerol-3-phosphate dehydrogenase [NAD(P)+] n=1 Tax=Naumannella halotolerans TaxID=993414 RepID=A0A4R7J9W4_9ACTN|nr:glycerol-3-phosphate dehydrogenase (NAD(P)+) [Naumannella halotolerans]
MRVAVLGAGAFGTVLSLVFADAGHEVRLCGRRADQADEINERRTNERYLPGIELPPILATTDQQLATDGVEVVVLAVPAQTMRENLQHWQLPAEALIVSAAKGLEAETGARMSELMLDAGIDAERLAVIAGPNLAREIGARMPTAAVVAAYSNETAVRVQRSLHSPYFRPYTNLDVVGCELAGAAKNPIALAVGMIIGRGLGDNLLGTVMSRGLAEATRLGEALGADPHTFAGLAGTGDLVATCYSPLSRNRSFGERLGRGMPVAEALAASSGVVEAIPTSGSLAALADEVGVELPIISRIAPVIEGQISPDEALDALMSRQVKPER